MSHELIPVHLLFLIGLLSWDSVDCHIDLEQELIPITTQALEGEEVRNGERLIQFASENLVTEVLIQPQFNTLIQCMRNLLSSFTRHRHVIHAGYSFTGNGSWILQVRGITYSASQQQMVLIRLPYSVSFQDGTFSVSDFTDAFQENDVQRVLRAYPDTITMHIHCPPVGDWKQLPQKRFAKLCRIAVNPPNVINPNSDNVAAFIGE